MQAAAGAAATSDRLAFAPVLLEVAEHHARLHAAALALALRYDRRPQPVDAP
jgi:hypothetical protein